MPLTLNGNGAISGLGDIDGHDLETNTLVNVSDATFASQAVGRATLFIDESSNTVGINTTTPAAAVFLEVADGTDPIVSLNNTGAGELRLGITADTGYLRTESNHALSLQTNAATRVFIDSNGETFIPSDVFIGYSKASWAAAGATQGDVNINGTILGNNGAGNLVLGCGVSGGIIYIGGGNTNTDSIRFQTDTSTKCIIRSTGQVGIGTTNLQARSVSIFTPDPGTGTNYLNVDADILISSSATAGGALKFESPQAAIVCGATVGGVTIQGRERVFASFDSNGIDLPNGGGINFSQAPGVGATSNLLDDYEEGTWTPTSGVGTITTDNSTYTKIGRFVRAECRINSFSNTSSTSRIDINGLPFIQNTFGLGGSAFGQFVTTINGNAIEAFLASTPGSLQLYQNSTGTYRDFTYSAVTNQTQLYIVFTYETS